MTSKQTTVKPWGGRFNGTTDQFVEKFTESVSYDQRLYGYDIIGSIAHAQMLAHVGILGDDEFELIRQGLEEIRDDINSGKFDWKIELEDVHMNIESALVELIGDVAKKLHTARSRNDQIATDLRMFLRDQVDEVVELLHCVMQVLVTLAEKEVETIMPGFTHMQAAQPVTFGHHMLAWYEMLYRDVQRMLEARVRINVMPLGSAALAGTSFPIDREYTAKLLEFDSITANSLDAVSDRDFAIEFCSAASLIMMHLSRFSEELILWISPQFAFIDLDDAFCTGSSIMPQKKNPDIPELVRGKTARVYGNLTALFTLMKAQPLAYNRDNQEDKETLFDTVDTVKACLQAYVAIIPSISVDRDVMRLAAEKGYATATDLADYLVKKGLPFRDAHAVVGQTVQYAMKEELALDELSLEQLQNFSQDIGSDVYDFLKLQGSVEARDHVGGTAPKQVRQAIQKAKDYLNAAKQEYVK